MSRGKGNPALRLVCMCFQNVAVFPNTFDVRLELDDKKWVLSLADAKLLHHRIGTAIEAAELNTRAHERAAKDGAR